MERSNTYLTRLSLQKSLHYNLALKCLDDSGLTQALPSFFPYSPLWRMSPHPLKVSSSSLRAPPPPGNPHLFLRSRSSEKGAAWAAPGSQQENAPSLLHLSPFPLPLINHQWDQVALAPTPLCPGCTHLRAIRLIHNLSLMSSSTRYLELVNKE